MAPIITTNCYEVAVSMMSMRYDSSECGCSSSSFCCVSLSLLLHQLMMIQLLPSFPFAHWYATICHNVINVTSAETLPASESPKFNQLIVVYTMMDMRGKIQYHISTMKQYTTRWMTSERKLMERNIIWNNKIEKMRWIATFSETAFTAILFSGVIALHYIIMIIYNKAFISTPIWIR